MGVCRVSAVTSNTQGQPFLGLRSNSSVTTWLPCPSGANVGRGPLGEDAIQTRASKACFGWTGWCSAAMIQASGDPRRLRFVG